MKAVDPFINWCLTSKLLDIYGESSTPLIHFSPFNVIMWSRSRPTGVKLTEPFEMDYSRSPPVLQGKLRIGITSTLT